MPEITDKQKEAVLLASFNGCYCGIGRSVLDVKTDKITDLGSLRCPIHSTEFEPYPKRLPEFCPPGIPG